jgi:hypothetical protein
VLLDLLSDYSLANLGISGKKFMDNLQRVLILPFIIILIVMLAIMAQITNLNPAGIGYGLTGVANFTLYGVMLALIVGGLASAVFYVFRFLRQRTKPLNRSTTFAPRILPGDLIPSDSEQVRALTYTGTVDSDQVIPPANQGPVTPISNTRRYKPFILPTAPLEQQVTQQVIIQPPAPGIGQGTQGSPAFTTPIQRSPIKFRR